jgi:hypothetical protein
MPSVYPWAYVLGIALLGVIAFQSVRRKRPYLAGAAVTLAFSQLGLLWGRSGQPSAWIDVGNGVLLLGAVVLFFVSFRRGEFAGHA